MGIYMKIILSEIPLDSIGAMKGVPAGLLITAVQQSVSFALLVIWMAVSSFTSSPWRPAFVAAKAGWRKVALLAFSFTCNIACNNYSLTLLPMSVNLIIRSCGPLVTLAVHFAMAWYFCEAWAGTKPEELIWITVGSSCSFLVVLSKAQTMSNYEMPHMVLGSVVCLCSLLASAMEVITVSKASADIHNKMTPGDLVFSTALPVTMLLIVPIFLLKHPVPWPGHEDTTDWNILMECLNLQPWLLAVIVLSGVFALAYNLLMYSLVQKISPEHALLGSNASKIITICLSVLFQFETIPQMPWGLLFTFGCMGTLTAFAIVSRMSQSKK
jgi:hypothetical protein